MPQIEEIARQANKWNIFLCSGERSLPNISQSLDLVICFIDEGLPEVVIVFSQGSLVALAKRIATVAPVK